VNGCTSGSLFPNEDILTKEEIELWTSFVNRAFTFSPSVTFLIN
jgi:hypothetical protein